MWKWRFWKLPPLLKSARSGNLERLSLLIDDGGQDILCLKDNETAHELVNPKSKERVVLDWKSHVLAWSLYVDAMFYLCESHRINFSDTKISRNACLKLVASLNTQPTSAACLAFGYLKIFLSSFLYDKITSKQYVTEAINIDPTCAHSANFLQLIEAKMKSLSEIPPCEDCCQEDKEVIPLKQQKRVDRDSSNTFNSTLKINFAEHLPEELSIADLGRIASVCTAWWQITNDFSLWKAQYLSNFFDSSTSTHEQDYKHLFKDLQTEKRHWRVGECVQMPLKLHSNTVNCLQFDSTKLITASSDKTLKVTDIKTRRVNYTLNFDAPVWSLEYNENFLISGATGSVTVFDVNNLRSPPRSIHTPPLTNTRVPSVSLSKNFMAAAVRSNIMFWNLDGVFENDWMEDQNEMVGHDGVVHSLQFVDANSLISAGEDSVIRMWDIHSNRVVNSLLGHQGGIRGMTTDGQLVVSGSEDGFLRFHDLRMRRCLQSVACTQGGVTCVKMNESRILTGHENHNITHWDVRYSKWDQEIFHAHKSPVTCLAFDRTKMFSGSYENVVRQWDFSSENNLHIIDEPGAIRFSHFKQVSSSNVQSRVCSIL